MRKYEHLQILRAVAASLVVLSHGVLPLWLGGLKVSDYFGAAYLAGGLGVDAFFVLSGLIITLQALPEFGRRLSPLVFLYRRLLRIAPLYWIATGVYLLQGVATGVAWPGRRQIVLSLCFVPNMLEGTLPRPLPVVAQGWTLNYEMAFYLLFAVALFLPRRFGIPLIIVVVEALVQAGIFFNFPANSLRHFYTDSVVLCLGSGVVIAWVLSRMKSVPRIRLPFSPALLLFVPALITFAWPVATRPERLWTPMVPFATGVLLVCLCAEQDRFGRFSRCLVLLGDASYSTYLFHGFLYLYFVPPMLWLHGWLHVRSQSPFPFLAMELILANLGGVAIHLLVERPIIHLFRKIPIGPPRASATSVAVGA